MAVGYSMNTIQYSSPPTNLNVNLNNNNSWTKIKVVHLVGGFSALVVTIYLGPRYCHQQSIGLSLFNASGQGSSTAPRRLSWGTQRFA